jgi:FKBP-type peptidyl-prolyl cis-trans isomerase
MDSLMHRLNRPLSVAVAACLLAAAGSVSAAADTKPAATPSTKPAATSSTESSPVMPSYAAGLQFGESLHRAGVTEVDTDAFVKGVKDALAGKVATPEDRERLNKYIADLRNNLVTRNHTTARDFLAKNTAAKGVVTTPSGLQYKVIQAGDAKAASPTPADRVTVQYRGTLLDGTEFDSSYARGTPATFPVNGVIKGWQEALVMMKPGAKWQLFVPPELAYDQNSRPPIPPGSLLLFDVELISIDSSKQ